MTTDKKHDKITLKELMKEIVNGKTELKNFMEAIEVRLYLLLEEQKNKITKLQNENSELRAKIEILERNQKKNNIVVFGLKLKQKERLLESTHQKLNSLLGIQLSLSDISNAYFLGNPEAKCPLKVELSHMLKNEKF